MQLSRAKINLGLRILFRREDGYHEIQSIFVPIQWGDTMEFTIQDNSDCVLESENLLPDYKKQDFETVSERGDFQKNILFKVWQKMREFQTNLPGVNIHLTKRIPTQAGLGGGSSNAASLIRFLLPYMGHQASATFQEKIPFLGADIPFFLQDNPCLVGGIGDKLAPVELASGRGILCFPDCNLDTKLMYSNLKKPLQKGMVFETWKSLENEIWSALSQGDWKALKGKWGNDFEPVAFSMFPLLGKIKESFLSWGAEYSAMTGSGSCIYGLFSEEEGMESALQKAKAEYPNLSFSGFYF